MTKTEILDQEPEVKAQSVATTDNGITSLYAGMSTDQLKKAVSKMTEQRKVIAEFVKSQLVEGVDYGTIEATSKSGKSFKTKPSLWKPGQEKIFSLFGLTSELEKDVETLEMLGNSSNLVAFKCSVYRNGQKVTEGRGAAKVGDLGRDENVTIKIAEKRARMDACLSLGFSEFFTQDMEDPDYQKDNATKTATPKQLKWLRDTAYRAMGGTRRYELEGDEMEADFNYDEIDDWIEKVIGYRPEKLGIKAVKQAIDKIEAAGRETGTKKPPSEALDTVIDVDPSQGINIDDIPY